MTVDEFTRTFRQCPVCKSPVTFEAGEIPSFACSGYDTCFAGSPEVHDVTEIGMVYLYINEYYYHYMDGFMFIHRVDDIGDGPAPEDIGKIVCDDKLMVTLFSKPKNIHKYFLIS